MSLILGIEYCKLDNNGRFKLPIAIKRQLEGDDWRFVFRPSIYAKCLELWPIDSFQTEIAHLKKELNRYSIEDRKMLRILSAGNIVEMDSSDRLVIPGEQRSRINLGKDIVLLSTGDYIEIWDYDAYCQMNDEITDYAVKVDERLGRVAHEPEC